MEDSMKKPIGHGDRGNLAYLRDRFTAVAADFEYGIFAIALDPSDPDFPNGSALLFSGDDGSFWPSTGRFPIEQVDSLAAVFRDAAPAAERVCVSSGRGGRDKSLRAHSVQPVPETMPLNADVQSHKGFLAANEHWATFVTTDGGDRDRVALHILRADPETGEWRRAKDCHIFWLPSLLAVAEEGVAAARDHAIKP